MSKDILLELYVFCKFLMLGVILCVAYDVIRISRRIIKRGKGIVAFEDVLAGVIAAFITFGLIYKENYGNLRGYIFSGMLVGMGLYWISISSLFVGIISKSILMLLQKINNAFKISKEIIISKVRNSCEKENRKEN